MILFAFVAFKVCTVGRRVRNAASLRAKVVTNDNPTMISNFGLFVCLVVTTQKSGLFQLHQTGIWVCYGLPGLGVESGLRF